MTRKDFLDMLATLLQDADNLVRWNEANTGLFVMDDEGSEFCIEVSHKTPRSPAQWYRRGAE